MTEQMGCEKVVLSSDSKPTIVASKDAVRKKSDIEAIVEEVLVGDHQAKYEFSRGRDQECARPSLGC